MNPEDVLNEKGKEWKYMVDMMKQMMIESSWKDSWEDTLSPEKKSSYSNEGMFQFNKENQKARISFNHEDKDPTFTELDLTDPMACGLAVISAFTKSVLK